MNINFIIPFFFTEELIRSALALLDTLCYVPINNDLLGRYIASPGTFCCNYCECSLARSLTHSLTHSLHLAKYYVKS